MRFLASSLGILVSSWSLCALVLRLADFFLPSCAAGPQGIVPTCRGLKSGDLRYLALLVDEVMNVCSENWGPLFSVHPSGFVVYVKGSA